MAEEKETKAKSKANPKPKKVVDRYARAGFVQAVRSVKKEK